ncbi:unnamed protein product [Acanthoscelides obtectus]|uniref:Uncharacterized protein n=1 Tax=Acanthoscelides obtectus TaxID=200917 RepID=A0A9P0LHH5_ACAOB|nr:unnamed protein product [Acanthoscelides obtectus]CAK1673063.1 hypothetical protein AOBTE_LOCUS29227 [Acanthoscelides obtectus]
MVIGTVDKKTTKVLEKRWKRKNKTEEHKISHDDEYKKCETNRPYQLVPATLGEEASSSNSSEENAIKPEDRLDSLNTPSTSQKRIKLPSVALACDRTGVSDKAAAILVSAALKDMGIVTTVDSSKIVDRSKIRRERAKVRVDLKRKDERRKEVYGIYFDGRKDQTLVQTSKEGISSKKTKIEEHIVLVSEPGSKYIGHFTPESGNSLSIKRGILDFLEPNFDVSNLLVIGCDGTAVNTGSKNGIIRQLEVSLNRSLQWFVCLLHANDL